MSAEDRSRKPQLFRLDDTRLGPAETAPIDEPASTEQPENQPEAPSPGFVAARLMRFRRIGWGTIFWSAVTGLIAIGLSLWVTNFVIELFTRGGWLGYLALGLAVIAAFAALVIAVREIVGFFRLGRVAALRLGAENALSEGDKARAAETSRQIAKLFAGRPELQWNARRLEAHRGDVLDAREWLILTEREMLAPLDRQARQTISASARRVALITAVSPAAIIDVVFVVVENLGMLRRLATLYGGRPGFFGSLRLGRLVLGHLALTGGVALGDDFVQQLIGHGLTARLSARLGEGIMNGAFTGRIGIAAIEVCRPLPFIEAPRPRLRTFLAELRKVRETTPEPPKHDVRDK